MDLDMQLVSDVKQAEGCRLVAYQDTGGVWTIGYGHTGPEVKAGLVWTQADADAALASDLTVARGQCVYLPEWPVLNDCRGNAVTELVFNMGIAHWEAFHITRGALLRRDWKGAHDGLLDSEWANQVQRPNDPDGRATRLAGYLLNGTY